MKAALTAFCPQIGVAAACSALGVARASWYRQQRPAPVAYGPKMARKAPCRKLSPNERQTVLDTLNAKRFQDKAPGRPKRWRCGPRSPNWQDGSQSRGS